MGDALREEAALQKAAEILLKHGNELFSCPDVVTVKKEVAVEKETTAKEPEKDTCDDDIFELV
jgi:hypothetical protein